uniref:Uncharacterized protein n=1 Tax=Oncorhynchus kisutch TaxID=8019 RepID=A0A8C7IJQ1_ONCKI
MADIHGHQTIFVHVITILFLGVLSRCWTYVGCSVRREEWETQWPLQVLELPYLSLTPADLSYLSCSPHASSLQQLDLSENRLDELALPSVRRLLSQASSCLMQLSLSGCGLTDGLLAAMLPSLSCCWGLKSLGLALNPLSLAGLLDLVRTAVRMPSLRQLLYPNPLEDYQPGLPPIFYPTVMCLPVCHQCPCKSCPERAV